MNFFPTSRIFLEINIGSFHLQIAWYAILILTGAILAYTLSIRQAKKLGYNKDVLEDFFITMLPLAIIGARIYYCIFEWQRFASDPISVFYIWEGGLAIHGGLIVGVVYAYFYFRYKGINLLRVGDCIMPNVFIAQVIGRWGNFMNQEAYGQIVSEDYFTHFPAFIKQQMYIDGYYRQPMFLYEGIGNLIGFILIKTVFKKYGYKKRGDMIYAYIAWYGIVRFFVEGFRSDSLMFMGLKVAQLISLVFVLAGVLGLVGVYNKVFKKVYPFKKEKPIVLFDADGTLVDSEKLIKDSFLHTFAHYLPKHELSEDELHSFMGPPLRDTFEKYLPAQQVDEAVEYYREYNHEKHDDEVTGMLHAKEMVAYLKAEGYTLG
ncbi:MAG: prolipoprotein diacylglyceryl transferase, partial [Erysipelotrichia bacterium]|nr:prolipoprotein diacylglyceryl transferase [Erysipelotrichia bacterium]